VFLSDVDVQEYVGNFVHPGDNITGFASDELALNRKRLGLLHELSPRTIRVLYIMGKSVGVRRVELSERLVKDAAAVGITLVEGPADSAAEIDAVVEKFSHEPNGGLVIAFNAFTTVHREIITDLAARHRLPAVYPLRAFAGGGGLLSYGVDQDDQFRQAASYADRFLKVEEPGDLPVQLPTKYQLVINLKSAKELGLTIPPTLLAHRRDYRIRDAFAAAHQAACGPEPVIAQSAATSAVRGQRDMG
jgi:putative ABC transport system substrate-binding protein